MRSSIAFGVSLLLVGYSSLSFGERPLDPDDILSIRWATHVTLSPDGKSAAYLVHEAADRSKPKETRSRTLWLAATDQSSKPRPIAPSHKDVTNPHWSPVGTRLAFLSEGENDKTQVWIWNAETDQVHCETSAERGVNQYHWSPDGKEIAYKTAPKAKPDNDPIVVAPDKGRDNIAILRLTDDHLTSIPLQSHVVDFDLSPDDETIAAIVSDFREWDEVFREARVVTFDRNGKNIRVLSKRAADFIALRWSPNGKTIAFMEYGRRGFGWRVATVDVATGKISHPLEKIVATPMGDFQWSPDSKSLWVRVVEQTRFHMLRADIVGGDIQRVADNIHSCFSFSLSADGKQLALTASDPAEPTYVEFLPREDAEPVRLTSLNPHIRAIHPVNIQQVEWNNRKDGKKIYGVLLTPHDHVQGQPGKTVVLLHGGPQGVWWNSWVGSSFYWAQMLATHGYVVFLPNPRGSLGQSWRFSEAVHADWGGMDVQDILDGIDMLVGNKTIDPDRIGVGGWSYGGFLTASITTQTDRFKAAIVGAGITDLPTYAVTVDEDGWVRRLLGGNEIENRERFVRLSPLTHIAKCKTPTLVLHGEKDLRCPLDQGRAWYRGLQFLNVETAMVVYPREGHLVNERGHRADMLSRVLGWYDSHLTLPEHQID